MNDFARNEAEPAAAWLARLDRLGQAGVAADDRPRYDACRRLAERLAHPGQGDVRRAVEAVRLRRCVGQACRSCPTGA